jgi:hypothetical protein
MSTEGVPKGPQGLKKNLFGRLSEIKLDRPIRFDRLCI